MNIISSFSLYSRLARGKKNPNSLKSTFTLSLTSHHHVFRNVHKWGKSYFSPFLVNVFYYYFMCPVNCLPKTLGKCRRMKMQWFLEQCYSFIFCVKRNKTDLQNFAVICVLVLLTMLCREYEFSSDMKCSKMAEKRLKMMDDLQ